MASGMVLTEAEARRARMQYAAAARAAVKPAPWIDVARDSLFRAETLAGDLVDSADVSDSERVVARAVVGHVAARLGRVDDPFVRAGDFGTPPMQREPLSVLATGFAIAGGRVNFVRGTDRSFLPDGLFGGAVLNEVDLRARWGMTDQASLAYTIAEARAEIDAKGATAAVATPTVVYRTETRSAIRPNRPLPPRELKINYVELSGPFDRLENRNNALTDLVVAEAISLLGHTEGVTDTFPSDSLAETFERVKASSILVEEATRGVRHDIYETSTQAVTVLQVARKEGAARARASETSTRAPNDSGMNFYVYGGPFLRHLYARELAVTTWDRLADTVDGMRPEGRPDLFSDPEFGANEWFFTLILAPLSSRSSGNVDGIPRSVEMLLAWEFSPSVVGRTPRKFNVRTFPVRPFVATGLVVNQNLLRSKSSVFDTLPHALWLQGLDNDDRVRAAFRSSFPASVAQRSSVSKALEEWNESIRTATHVNHRFFFEVPENSTERPQRVAGKLLNSLAWDVFG